MSSMYKLRVVLIELGFYECFARACCNPLEIHWNWPANWHNVFKNIFITLSAINLFTHSFTEGVRWSSGISAANDARGPGSRSVYYLPCSDLGQVVNLSLSVA